MPCGNSVSGLFLWSTSSQYIFLYSVFLIRSVPSRLYFSLRGTDWTGASTLYDYKRNDKRARD